MTQTFKHVEGQSFQAIAYVQQSDNSDVQQGDVSSIEVSVFDLDSATPTVAVYNNAAVPVGSAGTGPSIWNAVQTDGFATRAKRTKYNFRPTAITDAQHAMRVGRRYDIVYWLHGADVDGGDIILQYRISEVIGGYATP